MRAHCLGRHGEAVARDPVGRGQELGVRLSVVVVVYDMPYAAPRSLFALSDAYQRDLAADEYEVIVVDNGSRQPLSAETIRALPDNFRCLSLAQPQPSPAAAANLGLQLARGAVVGLILDGARLATARLLSLALRAAISHPRAVVTTVGWLLGYGQADRFHTADDSEAAAHTERVLHAIDWPRQAERLLEAARLDGSNSWFGPGFESPALFMPRGAWHELGGLDERFDEAGGGFVALDLYARSLALPGCAPMLLLGEGTVHQPHGGISTDAPTPALIARFTKWREHYIALAGHDLQLSTPAFTFFGALPEAWRAQLVAWALRETFRDVPELNDIAVALDAALAADPCPQGTVWTELNATRDRLLEARRAAAARAADAAGLTFRLQALEQSWSWRITAPLRWLAARLRSNPSSR